MSVSTPIFTVSSSDHRFRWRMMVVQWPSGTYLRQGKTIRFTSGPRKGEAYRVESEVFLRRLGTDGNRSATAFTVAGASSAKRGATTTSTGSGMSAPRARASAMIVRAVSSRSSSTSDAPIE